MLGFGKRSTFHVNIPMVKEQVFSLSPYEIFKVSVRVELTTSVKTYVAWRLPLHCPEYAR